MQRLYAGQGLTLVATGEYDSPGPAQHASSYGFTGKERDLPTRLPSDAAADVAHGETRASTLRKKYNQAHDHDGDMAAVERRRKAKDDKMWKEYDDFGAPMPAVRAGSSSFSETLKSLRKTVEQRATRLEAHEREFRRQRRLRERRLESCCCCCEDCECDCEEDMYY